MASNELLRLFQVAVKVRPTPVDAPTAESVIDDAPQLPASAEPLIRALQLNPQSAAHYSQLATLSEQHGLHYDTQATLWERAALLLPRDQSIAFSLSNARKEQFYVLHRAVPGRPEHRGEAALREARKQWLASLRSVTRFDEGKYSATVNHNLGTVLGLMGKSKESEACFARALMNIGISVRTGRVPSSPGVLTADDRSLAKDSLTSLDLALAHQGKPRAIVHDIGVKLGLWARPDQRAANYTQGLLACPFHRKDQYGLVPMIEDAADDVRTEMMELLRRREDELDSERAMWFIDHERIAKRPSRWMRRHVGCAADEDARDAPKTCEAVRRAMRWWYSAALGGADAKIDPSYMKAQISIMAPGTHVAPHTGPTNERLVISLGLAGLDGAQLRVGDEWTRWHQGEAILFDDSFEHEVKIEGDEPRAVLIVHFQHPQVMPAGTNGASVIASDSDVGVCLSNRIE